jgi:hypothetical protein
MAVDPLGLLYLSIDEIQHAKATRNGCGELHESDAGVPEKFVLGHSLAGMATPTSIGHGNKKLPKPLWQTTGEP